jgi:hypothetical protein
MKYSKGDFLDFVSFLFISFKIMIYPCEEITVPYKFFI